MPDLVKYFSQDPVMAMNVEQKKKVTPSLLYCMNICGKCYFLSVFGWLMYTSLVHTLPTVYADSAQLYRERWLLAYFVIFNVVANFVFVCAKKSFYDERSSGRMGLPTCDWQHCLDCNQSVPPKAHHCPLCKHCILRRDHHCFFTGSCVSLDNHRYFLAFCFHCTVGALYVLVVLFQYISIVFIPIEPMRYYDYFFLAALFEWLFGYLTGAFFYYIILAYVSAITLMGSLSIFLFQMFLVSQGVTSYDFGRKGIVKYQFRLSAVLYNFREALGPYWPLSFVLPMPCLKVRNQFGNPSKVA